MKFCSGTRLTSMLFGLLLSIPAWATTTGPPADRSGVPGTNDCTACHRTFAPANSDARGNFEILVDTLTYRPGVKQNIKVKISHPTATKWGFQLTARTASDTTKMAGGFTITPDVRVRCANGTFPASTPTTGVSCEGANEFASHSAASTRPGTANGTEWTIEWTPPANEVGEIILYAAGNAANNADGNQNDRIYTTSVKLAASGSCGLTRRPTLRSISNAASFASTVAPGSLASVFGLDFEVAGRTRAAASGDLINGAFPLQLGCVAVEIGGKRSPITYVQTDQINFQVPTDVPAGANSVSVILNPGQPNELKSDVGTVTVERAAPGWFTFNGRALAALDATNRIVADTAVVPSGVAVKRGEFVVLYGTGFGPTNPAVAAGAITRGQATMTSGFVLTIGGIQVLGSDITYAGLAPSLISGLYQINAKVPMGVSPGSEVPVVLTIGSNSTRIANIRVE